MITGDVQTLQHHIENWEKRVIEYVKKNKDNMVARNLVAQRTVGPKVGIDQVEFYDRTEDWDSQVGITAKGAVPDITGLNVRNVSWNIYRNSTGWFLNEKDIQQDPQVKSRLADLGAKNIHRQEDNFVLEGNSRLSINGVVDMGSANPNGKIQASGGTYNNKGAWSGETGTDIYDDLLTAKKLLGENFDATYLIGRRTDMLNLHRLDSERQPYLEMAKGLFGAKSADFMMMSENFNSGTTDKVYMVAKDQEGNEFVIGENPKLESYPKQPGQNYFFELNEWVAFEAHDNESVVEINVS